MRGSMFVATDWGRHPLRPYSPVRMGQNVVCDGDVCRVTPPPGPAPAPPPAPVNPPAPNPVPAPAVTVEESFPIVPIAIGAGALILVAALL